jgi:predicted permease
MSPMRRDSEPGRDQDAGDREIREELEFHLEMRTRDNIAGGMSQEEARAEAERRFGRRSEIHARVRAYGQTSVRPAVRLPWLADAVRDVRLAARSFGRRPAFAGVVIFTLALGVGANTAVFSLANAILLREVPGLRDAASLVTLHFGGRELPGAILFLSHPDYEGLVASPNLHIDGLSTVSRTPVHFSLPGWETPRRLTAELVSDNHTAVLGLNPHLGAAPGPEHRFDGAVAMISHHLWTTSLDRDRDILGRTIIINGRQVPVIGVGPPGYRGTSLIGEVDVWIPLEAYRTVLPGRGGDRLTSPGATLYGMFYGRLRPGSTAEQFEASMQAAAERVSEAHPNSWLRNLVAVVTPGVGVTPDARSEFAGIVRILAAVVGFLLVLACANAANLLLVRGAARTTELSIRRAIGADRGGLVRQLLTEALLLAAAGGAAGLGLAWLGLLLFRGERILSWMPALTSVTLDYRVLLFAFGASLATGLLFGVAPALISTRRAEQALRGTRTAGRGRRLRGALVVVQVALSLALVVGAGLLLETVRGLRSVDFGFDPRIVTEASIDPATQGYDEHSRVRYFSELLRRVRETPNVTAAGYAWAPIQGYVLANATVRPEGLAPDDDRAVRTRANQVSPGFIDAAGMRLLEGRDFRDDETFAPDAAVGVIILSESAARLAFPGGSAVGRRVDIGSGEPRIVEVVGIVSDARMGSPRDEPGPLSLEPLGQSWVPTYLTLYARSASGQPLVAGLHAAARSLDPALPFYDVQSLSDRIDARMSAERILARLSTLFAALAILLAAVGIYGVLSYSINERAREIGVRLALGAPPWGVLRMVLRQSLGTVAIGITAGLFLAAQIGRLVASRLYGVHRFQPTIFLAAAATLLIAALLASWIPAWRATRVDPVRALRSN